jgi:hypothetical protein
MEALEVCLYNFLLELNAYIMRIGLDNSDIMVVWA